MKQNKVEILMRATTNVKGVIRWDIQQNKAYKIEPWPITNVESLVGNLK